MSDLFDSEEPQRAARAAESPDTPLADRMRPRSLDEVEGPEEVVGANGFLRRAIAEDRVPSLIFWGPPGVGKTTLAYAAGRRLGREVYILQATVDTRPEDLLITPVIEGTSQLKYVASPLVTAMLRGGVAILDEGNRMSEKSWASLAPLLDSRRYVESITAGVKIKAHPDFRMVATMNDDSSTFDLPEYIHSRLQPQILIDFPEREEELAILRENLPFAPDEILQYVTDFLQQAHAADETYTVRDGINIARYALKLRSETGQPHRLLLQAALRAILGEEAMRYSVRR